MTGVPVTATGLLEILANPAAGKALRSYVAADRLLDVANAVVEDVNARLFSNAGDVTDWNTLLGRINVATSDAQARSANGMLLKGLIDPNGVADAARSLLASGYGLGVGIRGSASFTPKVGSTPFSVFPASLIALQTDLGVTRRAFYIQSTLDVGVVSVGISLYDTAASQSSAFNCVTIQVVAGASGIVDSLGSTAGAVLTGAAAHLDFPAQQISVTVGLQSGAPTTGSVTVTYLGQT